MLPALVGLWCIAALLAIGALAVSVGHASVSQHARGLRTEPRSVARCARQCARPPGRPARRDHDSADRTARYRCAHPHRCAGGLLSRRVNLGGAAASLYALGYGRHEPAPLRVLPFFPLFLAAMNLVLLADDAFVFLVAWEFMSLDLLGCWWCRTTVARTTRGRLHLPGHGELRHALSCCSRSACWPVPTATTPSPHPGAQPSRTPHRPHLRSSWCLSGRDRRPAWCRCMSGCRSPIRPRRAMSRR